MLPAWVAEMDYPLAAPIGAALSEAVRLGDCGYASPEGLGLAEALAAFAGRRLDWPIDPGRVTACGNVVGAISSLLGALTKPGDRVVVNTPVYHPFFSVIEEAGCELAEAPLGPGSDLDVEAIEACFAAGARVLILCSPHNPTGQVPGRRELATIAEAAERHGAWVLSDEIHSPLALPGARHVPFLTVSPAAAEHGIGLISASKAFNVAGLGCAEMVTASDRAQAVVESLPFGARHCGQFGAIASTTAFTECDSWLDDVIAVLDHNRGLLAELLGTHLPGVGYRRPRAGYLAWLDFRALGLGDDPAAKILERGRLALNHGPEFGRAGSGFARLNFGTSPALLEQAVERLAEAVRHA